MQLFVDVSHRNVGNPFPPLECSSWTADDSQGIGGGGVIQLEPDVTPAVLYATFNFGVSSLPCGRDGQETGFNATVMGEPTFTPGTTQSVWPSAGGGTFVFNWIYS